MLGARAGDLVRQVFTESALVALAGTCAGVLLTLWVRDALIAAMPDGLHRSSQIGIDARVLGFTVGAGAISALLTGLLPALRGSLLRPADLLQGAGSHGATRTRRRLSASLVGAEVALAVVVLSVAGLLVNSFLKLRAVDPGFVAEGLLTFTITPAANRPDDEASRALHRQVLAALATIPQLQQASAGEMLPLSGNRSRYGFRVVDGPRAGDGRIVDLDLRWVDPHYFDVMGIPVKAGRGFTAAGSPRDGVLINERAARDLWPGADSVVGRQFFHGNSRATVIGVVGDVRHIALDAEPVSEIYYRSGGSAQMTYVARTSGSPAALERTITETVEAAAPVKVADFTTFDEIVTHSVRVPQFRARLFSLMGLLVAVLAMVGVFSVTAYAVAERQREIGIRMALGARPGRTVRFMMAQASVPVAVGLVGGLTVAFNTNHLVSRFLFATTPRDPLTVSAVIVGVFVTAMLAAYIPARRVLRVDPTTALRAE
jgi:predicted permease